MREPDSAVPGEADQTLVEQLLVECLDALTLRGPESVDEILASHPRVAAAVRERMGLLEQLGMLDLGHRTTDGVPGAPAQLGDFRILRRIGSGGMGVVYLAEQIGLARKVALKVLPHGALSTEVERERFRREARAIARLDHPNVVRVLATGEDQGLCWIAMEHVPGRGLDEVLREATASGAPPRIADVLAWGCELAGALGAAHRNGIVHRDVKPGNVRITPEGRAKLLDFGLARIEDEARLSASCGFRGSPYYAAPEQVRSGGGEIGPGVDVYSLGVTLYECLAGRVPFGGDTTEQVFHAILTAEPEPLARRGSPLPRDLDAVISKAIEKRPGDRYPDADAFADDLSAVIEYRSVRARRPRLAQRAQRWVRRHRTWAVGVAISGVAVIVGLLLTWLDARARAETARRDVLAALASAQRAVEELGRTRAEFVEHRDRRGELLELIKDRRDVADWDGVFRDSYAELNAIEECVLRRSQAEQRAREQLGFASRHAGFEDDVRRLEADLFVALHAFSLELEQSAGPSAFDWVRSEVASSFYRDLAVARDLEGRHRDALRPEHRLRIVGCAPGTELHVFVYRDLAEIQPGGERRLVPVPLGGAPAGDVRPGMHGLRVVEPVEPLRSGDFVYELAGHRLEDAVFACGPGARGRVDRLTQVDEKVVRRLADVRDVERASPAEHVYRMESVDGSRREIRAAGLGAGGLLVETPVAVANRGGVTARLWRDGDVLELDLPAGARFVPTASPVLFGPRSRVNRASSELWLEAGDYLVVARVEGRVEQRRIAAMSRSVDLKMDPPAPVPALSGFVYVQTNYEDELARYWMQEREVTSGEYLRFLNDPGTLRAIESSVDPILAPRHPGAQGAELLWVRGPTGFVLPPDWDARWPVVGVSWDDAHAFVAWRNRTSGDARVRFSLPTWSEWYHSAVGPSVGRYPWGEHFRPSWTNSCYSRSTVGLEPACSYVRDMTPLGIYDAAGSVFEWVEDWFSAPRGERMRVGGSWEYPNAEFFRPNWWTGAAPDHADQSAGFRLVARVVAAENPK